MVVVLRWLSTQQATLSSGLIAVILLVPLITISFSLLDIRPAVWQHLWDTQLLNLVSDSLLLALGVGLLSAIMGSLSAWLVAHYRFVGARFFRWALILPLAMPAYIIAYTYTGMFESGGLLQIWLQTNFDVSYVDVRNRYGAILLMSLVLYPYVFLFALAAFESQAQQLHETAESLGYSHWQRFRFLSLPMALPAIAMGTALVVMETLADYGTVAYFGINTFTTGIFQTWFGLNQPSTALQLAFLLCLFVAIVLFIEQRARQKQRFYSKHLSRQRSAKMRLRGYRHALASLFCLVLFLLGFALPAWQLIQWAGLSLNETYWHTYLGLLENSFILAAVAALVILIVAVGVNYFLRQQTETLQTKMRSLLSLGYALPGTVIAFGLLVPFGAFDQWLNGLSEQWFNYQPGLIFSGSMAILIFAYVVRFMSVGLHHTGAAMQRISPAIDEVSKSLGAKNSQILRQVHMPLLSPSIYLAALLIFVDVLKELPATLILRPYDFNTLAVKVFEYASDEQLTMAALPAITIVLLGLIPVLVLSKAAQKTH